MKMIRKPTFAGKAAQKDQEDIFYWAYQKTPSERLAESWRLHSLNHGLDPSNNRLNKDISKASKRNVE